jgi:glycolate oxidase
VTDVIALLRAELGDRLVTDGPALDEARVDKSGYTSPTRPLAQIDARSIEDVQTALRIASATRTPVVTRGAGTGLAGGAIGGAGELVLSTLAMNRVIELVVDDELVVVQPGVINGDLNAELAKHGFWFAPDPASRAISTIGGNIATNAGGLLCAKYGVTRDAVLGLTVVLASGEVLTLGRRTAKGVTGLDLTALLVGSEGQLGVIVEAVLRIRRIDPSPTATVGAHFVDIASAASAVLAISAAGHRPALMELIDRHAEADIAKHLGVRAHGQPFLLIQTDGPGAAAEAAAIASVIESVGGRAEFAADSAEAERLLEFRRSFHAAMARRGTVLIEDVCVPRSALAAMFAEIERIGTAYGLSIPTVAHAGDGNLHPNFVFEPDASAYDGVPPQVWVAAGELFEAALRLGGTLTGEHGVGLLKRRWLGAELGAPQLELQRQLRAVFDPLGILNPGKTLS